MNVVTYLGDGAYASYDGYQVRIYTSDGIRTTNEVYLEPLVLKHFMAWLVEILGIVDLKPLADSSLLKKMEKLEALVEQLTADDHCWIRSDKELEKAKILPLDEFLFSCAALHSQKRRENGVLEGMPTYAALALRVAELENLLASK